MKRQECIISDPGVMLGKPVIKGTRLTVELIQKKLREGATYSDLMTMYPSLSRECIQAALTFQL
ncbi:DUF433 domain-containing protein [Dyadobacter jiangsuensis]